MPLSVTLHVHCLYGYTTPAAAEVPPPQLLGPFAVAAAIVVVAIIIIIIIKRFGLHNPHPMPQYKHSYRKWYSRQLI